MKAYDVVVLGVGGAGMTAAFVAASEGARVLLLERTGFVGGTTSRSAGTLWIPGNFSMTESEARDDIEAARRYLDGLVGDRSDPRLREQFLRSGPAMLRYLHARSTVRFNPCPRHSDYHPDLDGARRGGRPVEAAVFDGRALGAKFSLLRPPLREFMVFGGMMVSKADIDALLNLRNSLSNVRQVASLAIRFARDRLRYARGTRLTMGNALCGSLLKSALDAGVDLVVDAETVELKRVGTGSHSIAIRAGGVERSVTSARAVVFAGGGFSANAQWRERYMPHPTPAYTAACEGNDASTQAIALAQGGVLGRPHGHNAWWFPSSCVRRDDGTTGVFPHIILDRAKPGLMAVDARGRRFVNEGSGYHTFGSAQYAAGAVPCWLVCDRRFVRKYGLGPIRPGGQGLHAWTRRGYLARARTIETLAAAIGVDPAGLHESVRRMNVFASSGHDDDFGKGADALSRQNGDASHGPNPCLGPIDTPPFFAVKVAPADLGTSLGLLTNEHAQLVDAEGRALGGLYACGNDMDSIMGDRYPAPGVTLGPGMTFGYIAARHALGRT